MCLYHTAWLSAQAPWLGSKLVESHWPWTGICSSSAEGPWEFLSLHSELKQHPNISGCFWLQLSKQIEGLVRFEGHFQQWRLPWKSFLRSVKSIRSVLSCSAVGQSNCEHPAQPGLGACGVQEPEVWEWDLSSQAERVQRSQGHCRGLSSCLACLLSLLFPVAGQMWQMLYLGHYSAAALPRKLSRLWLYCTGSCGGIEKEPALTPKSDGKEAALLCFNSEISPPILPSLAWSSSSLALIFLTQM